MNDNRKYEQNNRIRHAATTNCFERDFTNFNDYFLLFPVRRHNSERLVRCLAHVFKLPRTSAETKSEIIQGHKIPKSLLFETSTPFEDLLSVQFPNLLFKALGLNVTRGKPTQKFLGHKLWSTIHLIWSFE